MKKKKGKNMTEDKTFIPKEKQVIHLDQGKFIPFKQNISRAASLNKPFIPLTIEDALARHVEKDK
tara:strand:- start:980 stop:1174 length:195 start_codon:yes stop_codon:yes gene_type:complete